MLTGSCHITTGSAGIKPFVTIESDAILKAALQIHSVEARHAAHIRFARRLNGFDPIVKPWIVGVDNTIGTPLEAMVLMLAMQ